MKRNKNLLILYYLWKNLSKFSNEQKKVFHAADSKFSFNVSLCKINCFKIQTINLVSKSILAEVLCVLFTLTSSFDSDWKKTSSQLNVFFSRASEIKICGLVQQLYWACPEILSYSRTTFSRLMEICLLALLKKFQITKL